MSVRLAVTLAGVVACAGAYAQSAVVGLDELASDFASGTGAVAGHPYIPGPDRIPDHREAIPEHSEALSREEASARSAPGPADQADQADQAGSAEAATEYSERTDVQLTELAAQWESLDNDQRRSLLTEVQHRMAANKAQAPIITIKTRRRYGRTFRRADGALVRIETTEQVLRYHRPPGTSNDKRAFGMGFERRVANETPDAGATTSPKPSGAGQPADSSAPVITVGSESR